MHEEFQKGIQYAARLAREKVRAIIDDGTECDCNGCVAARALREFAKALEELANDE